MGELDNLPTQLTPEQLRALGLAPPQPAMPAQPVVSAQPSVPAQSPMPRIGAAPPGFVGPKSMEQESAAAVPAIPRIAGTVPPTPVGMASPLSASPLSAGALAPTPKLPTLDDKQERALPRFSIGAPSPFALPGQAVPGIGTSGETKQLIADRQAKAWDPSQHGFWGKLGHGLATVGNIAGDIVAPGTMALIPGTQLHNTAVDAGLRTRLAHQNAAESEAALKTSQGNLEDVEAYAKLHPPAKADEFEPVAGATAPAGVVPILNKTKGTVSMQSAPGVQIGKEGELPLGDKVDQLNGAFLKRYQVLHPDAQALPQELTLAKDANSKDFDRLDKLMESTERATGTAATQAQSAELRRAMLTIAQQGATDRHEAALDRQDKEGRKIVQGTDSTGRTVMAPLSEANSMGLKNVMEVPASDQSKALSARQWVPLAAARGNTPDSMGLLQIVDELDKRKALGPIASRWNDFVVGKLGTGTGDPVTDQLVEALRAKIGLSQTLLMNLHVGSRGGSYMMEHFEDLADAGKLNANILRAGIKSELNYAKDRAMLPSTGPAGKVQVFDPQGAPHFVNSNMVEDFLKDPQYKGWHK